MAEKRAPVDITNMPDLVDIVEEVRQTNRPRVLRRDAQDVALVVPLPPESDAALDAGPPDLAAALAAGGSWAGLIDGEDLKEQLHAARGSHRASAPL